MGFIKNLFSNKKNEEDVETIEINNFIASTCLKSLGYSAEQDSVDNSILGIVNNQNKNINFTEDYFYEEAAFYLMLTLEAQESYGLIDNYIKLISQDPELRGGVSFDEILMQLKYCCTTIPAQRVSIMGIEKTLSDMKISEFLDRRYLEYEETQREQVACKDPIPTSAFSIGLSPRDHPLKVYLGKISDNISASVGISEDDGMSLVLIENALMVSYSGRLQAASGAFGN